MKNIFKDSFNRKILVLYMIFFAIICTVCIKSSDLSAHTRRTKTTKKKTIERKYHNLKEDYYYTMENFIVLLRKLVTLCSHLEDKVELLTEKYNSQQVDLARLRSFYYQHPLFRSEFLQDMASQSSEDTLYLDGVRVDQDSIREVP